MTRAGGVRISRPKDGLTDAKAKNRKGECPKRSSGNTFERAARTRTTPKRDRPDAGNTGQRDAAGMC
jgi:hypothetical protein